MSLPAAAASLPACAASSAPGGLRWFIFSLFFIFGGITGLNEVLNPELKGVFTLSYFAVMPVQSAFVAACFLVSLPAAALIRRIAADAANLRMALLVPLACYVVIAGFGLACRRLAPATEQP